jgi:prepilin peptidase CpaA
MGLSLPPRGAELALLAVVSSAAVYDVRCRRIPNWLTITGVMLGVALNGFLNPVAPGILKASLIGLGMAFGIYSVLYALRAISADDLKLMSAVGAIVGWPNWLGIFIITALLGSIMAWIVMIVRRRKKTISNSGYLHGMEAGRPYATREEQDVRGSKAMGLHHGSVIAISTLFYLALASYFT